MKKIIFLSLIFFFIGCKKEEVPKSDEGKPETPITKTSENLNISFLLDLSDRIDPKENPNPAMEYYKRDLQYINSVKSAFLKHIKSKKVIRLNDQMQVYFDPEPSDQDINSLSKKLRIDFDKNTSKTKLQEVDEVFTNIPHKIYENAIKDGNYVGSDIWNFFKNKVKDYCIKDKSRNILVILTDGYIYHKDSKFTEANQTSYITPQLLKTYNLGSDFKEIISQKKYGLIPANHNLENLEVIILGINPSKSNPFEGEVITTFWEKWLTDMGVKRFTIKQSDLPNNLDPVIQKLILDQ